MRGTADLFRLLWLSRPLMQHVEEMVRNGLKGTGLTVRMRAILEVLHGKGPLSVPDIARELQIQRQYVQVMVNEVEAASLVERKPNPRHRSSALIALTASGEAIISTILEKEWDVARQLAEEFTDQEIGTARMVTERLCHILEQRNPDAFKCAEE